MRPPVISTLLLPSTALVTARPSHRDQPPPSPSRNILTYVDPPPFNPGGDTRCSTVITADGNYLGFPSARIEHQSSGTIDCQTILTLTTASQTAGYRFSADWISLSAYARLEPGAYIERVNVSVGYYPAGGKWDVATAKSLYGKHGTGYDGRFNLSIPLAPGGGGGDGKLGATTCRDSAGDPRTGISVSVFVSLAHEMIEFDDTTPHYGTVGGESPDSQLEVSIEGVWEKC